MLEKFHIVLSLLLIFGFSAVLVGKEKADTYFPHAIGSFWVYEDQDGNELTRRAVAEEEIEGKTYHAFNYEPTLEDWTDYEHYVHPYFYQIREDGIAFFVSDEVEKAFEARLHREMEVDSKKQQGISTTSGASADFSYAIEVDAQDPFYLLPIPVVFDKEWTAMRISGSVTLKLKMQGADFHVPGGDRVNAIPITLVEKGKVVGTETVKTLAGTFENCLKIEYWIEDEAKAAGKEGDAQSASPDEAGIEFTTLWLAPKFGIVKFVRESDSSNVEKSLELTQYEVKSADAGGK